MTGCFVVYQVLDYGSPWNPMRIDNSLALQKQETPVGWQINDASLSIVYTISCCMFRLGLAEVDFPIL
jgi:hypothetical protein